MDLLRSKRELREWVAERPDRRRILVPTMGALHTGHTSLMDLAREQGENTDVVATIFVNPTQFGPNEDFDAYPRQLEADLEKCRDRGVSAVFAPTTGDMYSDDASISIHESRLSHRLCGASRPGHFDGVCTVVAKLFLIVRPDAAVFGEKDFQQLAVIRRMVRDLDFPIEIIGGPTVREADGLAMSSRNAYLTEEERRQAPTIFSSLTKVASEVSQGTHATPEAARQSLVRALEKSTLARIDYVDIVDSNSLEPLNSFSQVSPRLLAAVYFGKTRLIDNVGLPD